jgi:hypothetical protein
MGALRVDLDQDLVALLEELQRPAKPAVGADRSRTRSSGQSIQRKSSAVARPLHLPLAPTEGSLTSNLTEIGVRLWADSSLT